MLEFQRIRYEEITINSLSAATDRLRITGLAVLLICAVMWCNMFAQAYSFDDHIVKRAHVTILHKQTRERAIYQFYNCRDEVSKCTLSKLFRESRSPLAEKLRKKHVDELNALVLRQKKLQNMLNEARIGAAEIPFIKIKFSTNDVNIISAIFITFIELWMLFSARQINYLFRDENTRPIIDMYRVPIQHMFAISNPDNSRGIGLIRSLVIYITPVTLGFSIFWDLATGLHSQFIRNLGPVPIGGYVYLSCEAILTWILMRIATDVQENLAPVFGPPPRVTVKPPKTVAAPLPV